MAELPLCDGCARPKATGQAQVFCFKLGKNIGMKECEAAKKEWRRKGGGKRG